MGATNKLSALKVARLKAPGRYGDGGNLWLQVGPTGGKSWLLRYMVDGRPRAMGLGPVDLVTLQEARERALRARKLILQGVDPITHRDTGRAETRAAAAHSTFRECAARFVASHEAGWRNEKHRDQWTATLSSYAFPVFGDLPVSAIDTALVMRALEPIWREKPETASRTRGRIEAVLNWAAARGMRSGDNPARWRGHLDKLLPSRAKVRRVRHHPAMPYADLPSFMRELRARDSVSARCLEFVILTAARTGEAVGARWEEIDLKARLWTVPAERMKSARPHRVPLTDRAIEILKGLPREADSEWVFPGGRIGHPLSNMSLLQLMRGMQPAFVPHGFRSTFRDWAAEQTNHPRDIAEAALAHVIGDKVEAAYRRGDALEKRRALMVDWSSYCVT